MLHLLKSEPPNGRKNYETLYSGQSTKIYFVMGSIPTDFGPQTVSFSTYPFYASMLFLKARISVSLSFIFLVII